MCVCVCGVLFATQSYYYMILVTCNAYASNSKYGNLHVFYIGGIAHKMWSDKVVKTTAHNADYLEIQLLHTIEFNYSISTARSILVSL